MVESTYSENCSEYAGICSVHLKLLTPTNSNLTTVVSTVITEQLLTLFFNNLEIFSDLLSKECSAVIMPFLCQYAYPPCDVDGNAQFITREHCMSIRDEVCASEWRFAMATKLGSLLPLCEAIDANNYNVIFNEEEVNTSEPLKCHHQFKEFCGVCLPLCATFSQYSDQVKNVEYAVITASGIFGTIGGIIMLIITAIRRKTM